MFATSGDILNISLALGFIVLVIFLSILIFYTILVMRDVSKMTDDSRELVDRIHDTVMGPLKAMDFIVEKVKPYIESAIENRFGKGKK